MGAVLSQIQDGKEIVISYFSKQLKEKERTWSCTEREAWAIVSALRAFKYYIAHSEVEIHSDHRALVWLHQFKDEQTRLGRWSMEISNIKYKIIYRPGKENGPADALSRLSFVNAIAEQTIDIADLQAKDPLCFKIKRYLEEDVLDKEDEEKRPAWVKEIDLFQISDGLLFRLDTSNPRRNHPRLQLVVPFSLRRRVLADTHESDMASHMAYHRTYQRIIEKYYWPGLRQEVKLEQPQRTDVARLEPSSILSK